MSNRVTVKEVNNGERLDRFLVLQLPHESRSAIQRMITAGIVTVNGQQVSKHHFLHTGDVIVIGQQADEKVELVPQDVPVLFEDEQVIVIEKPEGMLVHPAPSSQEWTVADFLRQHVAGIETVGDNAIRPGIVHRLDRQVSGVLVAAKTQEAFESLKQQFQERSVEKEYRAIVNGVPANATDIIKLKIARSSSKKGRMAARPESEEGRDAWTEYDLLDSYHQRYAALAVRIKTGRTHQIRTHLSAIGHPVVGDVLYAHKEYGDQTRFARLFLHAHRLNFTHPTTGERMECISELPKNFNFQSLKD